MTCHHTAVWVATYPDGDKRYICFGCAVEADLDGIKLKLDELGYGERPAVCCAREEEPVTLGDEAEK